MRVAFYLRHPSRILMRACRLLAERIPEEGSEKSISRRLSFSQYGEDLALADIFGDRKGGFYVDIGAHHPTRFSNTFLFYRRGWRGLNVDAMPGSMAAFHVQRPADISIESGVSSHSGTMDYWMFAEPAVNGFLDEEAAREIALSYPLQGVRKVRVETLANILSAHLPDEQEIAFLTIDTEGHDLRVLESNDWARFRPLFICTENHTENMAGVKRFLEEASYCEIARLTKSSIYADRRADRYPSQLCQDLVQMACSFSVGGQAASLRQGAPA